MSNTTTNPTIDLALASEYRRTTYGVEYESTTLHKMTGKGLHNPSFPHRIDVWDNTRRPNPRNGQPVRFGDYGPVDGGNGRYLGPDRRATDDEQTFTVSAQSVMLAARPVERAPYGADLAVGQTVTVRYPDGRTVDMVVTARQLADPVLVPVA